MSILSVEKFSFQYLHGDAPALRDVTCTLNAGTVTAIVSANGAGKSTLCYALAGFIPHFFKGTMQGSVRVNGIDTSQIPFANLVTQVGMVFQNPFTQMSGAKLTVTEEIAFGLENLGIARAEMETRVHDALTLFRLNAVASQSPLTLSGGQQQRLALASIFVMRTPVMILDEPTAQLDPDGTRLVMETVETLAAQGRTIVLVEHKLEWVARLASRVLVLENGALLADGAPREILERAHAWGLNETRYAQAARLARERGVLNQDAQLPQTFEQAREWFAE